MRYSLMGEIRLFFIDSDLLYSSVTPPDHTEYWMCLLRHGSEQSCIYVLGMSRLSLYDFPIGFFYCFFLWGFYLCFFCVFWGWFCFFFFFTEGNTFHLHSNWAKLNHIYENLLILLVFSTFDVNISYNSVYHIFYSDESRMDLAVIPISGFCPWWIRSLGSA